MSALVAGRAAETPGRPPGTPRPRLVVAARGLVVLTAIAAAYHYSLLTLVRGLTLDTPLAYLGLVPFIALALAIVCGRRWRWEPDIHDRYVDYILGIPLLFVALVITVVLPAMASSFYWRWRLDLLALPVFVAGAVTIVFGIRTTLRIRTAIAFLFLAWPLPYTLLVSGWLQGSTDATIHALRAVVGAIPIAHPIDAGDGSLFWIPYGAGGFRVSVASACAGVNGSLGFLLVGAAVAAVVQGGAGRKLLWLGNGVVVTMTLNLVRILVIFGAGHAWGPSFALDALHPVIGLVTFNLGVGASLLSLPWFGLRLDAISAPRPRPPATVRPSSQVLPSSRPLPVQHAAAALCIVLAASALAGRADAGLREFQPVAQDLGQPRLGEWSAALARLDGWSVRQTDSYPWVQQYFGRDATWVRYAYLSSATTASGGATKSLIPAFVNVDVIATSDLGTFSTYGLEACYGFHNYEVLDTQRIDLGAGIVGHSLAYFDPGGGGAWTALYWEWPVETGAGERYERVILNVPTSADRLPARAPPAGDPFADLQLSLASVLVGPVPRSTDAGLAAVRAFLIGFARDLVTARATHA